MSEVREYLPARRLADLPDPPPGVKGWPWDVEPEPLPPTLPDGRPWPPIGLLTPHLNQARYLEGAIRSVLLQGYPSLQYAVEDGGSTDGSRAILEKYATCLTDCVIEPDRGQSHALNKGFARLPAARWLGWLNADDLLLPGALAAVGRWAAADPSAVAVIGRGYQTLERTGERRPVAPRPDLNSRTLRQWRTHAFLQPACFFSRAAFERAGGLDESLRYALDFDLWVKLGEIGAFDLIEAPLAEERVHADAKTQRAMGACYGEISEVLFRRGYAEDARQLIEQLYDELDYMTRLVRPLTDNSIYRRFLRPFLRRRFGPKHLKPDR